MTRLPGSRSSCIELPVDFDHEVMQTDEGHLCSTQLGIPRFQLRQISGSNSGLTLEEIPRPVLQKVIEHAAGCRCRRHYTRKKSPCRAYQLSLAWHGSSRCRQAQPGSTENPG